MELYELLAKIVDVLARLRIPYFVTGSLASMAYGEPRLTNDIDVVAAIRESHIRDLQAEFPEAEFYLSEDAVRDAVRMRSQFNIIHPASGLKVDVMIPAETAFNQSRFARARAIRPVQTYEATFASPEDVIVKKMEYYQEGGSEKHLRDITGMLKVSAGEIDETYITEWAERLGLTLVWDAIQRRLKE